MMTKHKICNTPPVDQYKTGQQKQFKSSMSTVNLVHLLAHRP